MAHMHRATDVLLIDDSDTEARDSIMGIRFALAEPLVTRLKDGEVAGEFMFRRGPFQDRPPVLPRLIVLEIDIPKAHGFVFMRHLRDVPEMQEVPIIVFTRTRNPIAIEDACAMGARACVAKPLDRGEYIAEIGRLVRRWLPPAAATA
jgi:two-component system, response regulator